MFYLISNGSGIHIIHERPVKDEKLLGIYDTHKQAYDAYISKGGKVMTEPRMVVDGVGDYTLEWVVIYSEDECHPEL